MQPNTIYPQQPVTPPPTRPVEPVAASSPVVTAGGFNETASVPVQNTAVRKSGKRGVMVAVIAAAVLLGIGYAASNVMQSKAHSNASNQAKAFIADLNAGNNQHAYTETSANLRSQQTESQFASAIGDLTAKNPSYQSQSIAFSGRTATFVAVENGLPQDTDGSTTGTFQINLVKSGLIGWKVDSVTVE